MQCKDIKMKYILPFNRKLETKGKSERFQLIQWQKPAGTRLHFSVRKRVSAGKSGTNEKLLAGSTPGSASARFPPRLMARHIPRHQCHFLPEDLFLKVICSQCAAPPVLPGENGNEDCGAGHSKSSHGER